MHEKKKLEILHLDPLGQGVSKEADKIYFTPKTLPGETILAQIKKKKKGVHFSLIKGPEDVLHPSKERETPLCSHFDQCPGCHFLHTPYSSEMRFKMDSLIHLFKPLRKKNIWPESLNIKLHKAPDRIGYRNRIQLHYNKKTSLIGLLNPLLNKIIPISECLIGNQQVLDEVQRLYRDDHWKTLIKGQKNEGHIEIYCRKDQRPQISINKPYAAGGFTQVNETMNEALKDLVFNTVQGKVPSKSFILDIFGGSGNLSEKLNDHEIYVVDSATPRGSFSPHQKFFEIDLYKEVGIQYLLEFLKGSHPDFLILDPPRSGIKYLKKLLIELKGASFLYVSCNPATLVRDLQSIDFDQTPYTLEGIHLMDLFPSTYHFETVVLMKKA